MENIYEDAKIKIPTGHTMFRDPICNAVKDSWNDLMDKMAQDNVEQKISFTKNEIVDLLLDYADALYEDNPPKSIFEDNSAYVRDFVDGYFSGEEEQ